MNKIESLIKLAVKGAAVSERVFLAPTGKSAVDINYIITSSLLIPVVIMITNIKHYQMFGDELIVVKDGVQKDPSALCGLSIKGDILLSHTSYPLGFLLVSLTSTLVGLKQTLEDGSISEYINEWKKNSVPLEDNVKLTTKDYIDFKIPTIK